MAHIKFINDENLYNVTLSSYTVDRNVNRIKIVFNSADESNVAPIENGFIEVNEHNYVEQADFSNMKYIYRQLDDITFILTENEEDVYVESEIVFNVRYGGTLNGEKKQVVKNYEDLVIPTPIPNENYEFIGWSPKIPTSGKIENSTTFTALFKYIPTLDEVKQNKIFDFSMKCNYAITNGVALELDGETEYFSYNDEDQGNIKEIFDLALQTKMPMYYHANGKGCRLYSVEQIVNLYSTASMNKMHHQTYFNQMKMYIMSLKDKETVDALEYGVTELTGEYLDTYNAAMEQAKNSVTVLLTQAGLVEV